jgi:hypothetical protein
MNIKTIKNMAKADWLTISPTSGSGEGSINNTASVWTGRDPRSTTVTVTANGCDPVTYAVKQLGKSEFINFTDSEKNVATSMSLPKEGQIKTVYILSNTKSVAVTAVSLTDDSSTTGVVEGGITASADTSNSSVATQTENNTGVAKVWVSPATSLNSTNIFGTAAVTAVSGDPGSQAQYYIPVRINLSMNDTITVKRTFMLKALAAGGQYAQMTFTQDPGAARLKLTQTSITLGNNTSGFGYLTISSNTSWSIASNFSISNSFSPSITTGSGDGSVRIGSANINYNHYQITLGTVTVSAQDVTNKTVTIYQASADYIAKFSSSQSYDNGITSYAVTKEAKYYTIYVLANESFTVSAGSSDSGLSFESATDVNITDDQTTDTKKCKIYVYNNADCNPDTNYFGTSRDITDGTYSVNAIRLNIPPNSTISSRSWKLDLASNSGIKSTLTITQAAGDPTISVSPTSITLAADGSSSVSVAVKSNTSWTVS